LNVRKRSSPAQDAFIEFPAVKGKALPWLRSSKVSRSGGTERRSAPSIRYRTHRRDSVIWFMKSNVGHMADDYFAGMFPLWTWRGWSAPS